MQMPRPGRGHEALARLAGTWEGDEQMEASALGPATARRGRYVMAMAVDGFFLIQDYEQRDGERRSYQGHGVFGWDAQRDEYTWYWADSFGGTPSPSRGREADGTWLFESTNPYGEACYTWRLEAPDRVAFSIENRAPGADWVRFMIGHYTRVSV